VRVQCDDGRTVSVSVPEQGPQTLRLADAGLAVRAQGAEAEVALVLPGAAHAHRQAAYPMLSRGTGEVHVFIHWTERAGALLAPLLTSSQPPPPGKWLAPPPT
jgi:hypothetical protein